MRHSKNHPSPWDKHAWLVLALCGTVACEGGADREAAPVGMLELALAAPASTPDTLYGLAGTFVLDDPESLSVTTSELDQSRGVTLMPRTGTHELELCGSTTTLPGCTAAEPWSLYLLTCTGGASPGTAECFTDPTAMVTAAPVAGAALTTTNPQAVTIRNGLTTTATFEFLVPGSGAVTFGRGDLEIALGVQVGYPDGYTCSAPEACQSHVCEDPDDDGTLTCQAPSCVDGVLNGIEVGADCGGGCVPCLSNAHFTDSGQRLGGYLSYPALSVDLGDLDSDGDLDALVVTNNQPIHAWLNDGSGSFADSGTLYLADNPWAAKLGDLDDDGDLDVFVVNGGDYGDQVWLNDGSGSFLNSGQSLGSSNGVGVDLGDLDGDGDLDAVVAVLDQPSEVWLNDGSGSFLNSGQGLGVWGARMVALGDLDGDGDLDVFRGDQVWLNDGSASFADSGQVLERVLAAQNAGLVDLDGDGDLDLLVGNTPPDLTQVWLNNGSGSFSRSGPSFGALFPKLGIGDLDGDGDLDAFVAYSSPSANNGMQVWLNDGSATFSGNGQSLSSSNAGYAVDVGDLDGDGDIDAFVGTIGPEEVWFNN